MYPLVVTRCCPLGTLEKYLGHSASGGDGVGGETTKLFHLNFKVEESECGRDRELDEHIEIERRICV